MSEREVAEVLKRAGNWQEAHCFNPKHARRANPDDELGFLVHDLIAALQYMASERDQWNAQTRRLSGGLLAIYSAPSAAPAAVLRSVAYDIALNCIKPDTAEYQIVRRAGLDLAAAALAPNQTGGK